MEETVKQALLAAGDFLADALREGLIQHGLDADLSVHIEDDRVVVASHSRAVWLAEVGDAGAPPKAPLAGVASRTASDVANFVRDHLEGAWP